ncbi:pleckstrin homology domain-containing family G member 5-like [Chelonus insularis]|uniref:pleckstrin homology domain-containing family G member 5-like n=1 Tax=Chelonus insularis TaxID=460826 RepID=UPI0015882E7C|nr:pleckstrin homology domain-containing family G member 5-like [Chelonus insularis]
MTLKKDGEKRQSKKHNKTRKSKICPIDETLKAEENVTINDDGKSYSLKTDTDDSSEKNGEKRDCKLDRKPSLRRKLGAFLRGSADLPAAINRSFQPIRRSFSFNKDLHRVYEPEYRTRNASWYNSLSSLAEVDSKDEGVGQNTHKDDAILNGPLTLTRTHSFLEDKSTVTRRKSKSTGLKFVYGRHSDHYDSSVDLSKPPFEACSLPVLTQFSADKDEVEPLRDFRRESRGWNGWGILRASARNSLIRLSTSGSKERPDYSVRSRSLSQLDMLDTGEHNLSGGGTQQSPQMTHHRYPSPHQPPLLFSPNPADCSPRLLVPSSTLTTDTSYSSNKNRHKLSRSQVSSSEYFSVSFEVGTENSSLEREEFLPATKGTYLGESLGAACERRGIDLSRVDVYLDAFSTPLPVQTTETSCLGGRHLRVTAKDEKPVSRSASQKSSQNVSLRKSSSTYRGRGSRFFSISTEDSSMDSEIGPTGMLTATKASSTAASGVKVSKQRWSGFFTNTKGTKMELLVEQLNSYTKHGVPRLPEIQLPYDLMTNEEELYALEEDWRDIVENWDCLTEKQQQQQTALWELAQTELAYIKTLKVVTDLFMACLCSLQASNILIEVDRSKLFSNIPEIYAANRYFWSEHVLRMMNASRSTGHLLDSGHLLQGFETFEQTFAPYTRYCSEQSKCQQYCRDRLNDNELFTAYLVWCETQKDCNRLRLLDILVKPMQRLTKYSLLLKAIHKNTEDEEQRTELTIMIKCVDNFVASVNAALRRSEEAARLASAATRLDCYDVVESRDEELEKLVKSYCNLDITSAPMPGCPKNSLRTLLREGDLKLRDAATSKTEVHAFLMTDMLLLCKPSTKKGSVTGGSGGSAGNLKIIRQPYVIDRLRIHELKESCSLGLVYLNEYGVASAAFILTACEPKLAKVWMESLRKAQQQFAIMKIPPLGEIPPVATVSRQPSTYLGDGDFELEENEVLPRTPRGSSRASRVSSLAHSHSGSIEMEGVSPGGSSFLPSYNPSRNVSVDTNEPPHGSSVSSEEGLELGLSHNHRPLQVRRSLLSKSPTPNTLSVQVPAYSSLGQSLPNLTLATSPQTSTVSPTPPNSLLIVPQITKSKDTLLSPGHRGISYPPPSPPRGALRRALAIPQSRNPPLIKTRHINASVASSTFQSAISFDTEAIEERRRRLESTQRAPSFSGTVKEEKKSEENR